MASLPVPDTDWNVVTTIRLMRARSCKGFSATTIWTVEQFGLAMMPLCLAMSARLTSGTTSGTSFPIRQAELLSITTAPALAAIGAYSRLMSAPAEKRAISTPSKES